MNPDVNLLANEDVYPVTTQTYTAVQLAWFLTPRPTLFIFLRF